MLHERRCRHPCKTRFRPAGSAFTGRASNPPGSRKVSDYMPSSFPGFILTQAGHTQGDSSSSWPISLGAERTLRRSRWFALAAVKRIDAHRARHQRSERRERLRVRQEQSTRLLAALEAWLREEHSRLSRSASVAQPIDYPFQILPHVDKGVGFRRLTAPAALAEPTDATVDATKHVPRQWGRRRRPVQSAQPQALLTGATRRKRLRSDKLQIITWPDLRV